MSAKPSSLTMSYPATCVWQVSMHAPEGAKPPIRYSTSATCSKLRPSENSEPAVFSLGGNFEQVAELLYLMGGFVPSGACIDTCHTHVAGYDIVSEEGFADMLDQLDRTVGLANVYVWHCNDAKAARGSKLDRHQHIGKGSIGLKPFRRLLNDPRLAHAAFIAETPIDEPLDDLTNVNALKKLVADAKASPKGQARRATG